MEILHLTDFHYNESANSKIRQDRIIKAIIEKLKDSTFDLLLFSGDLVNNGSKANNFLSAKNEFIDTILNSVKINKEFTFICQGNHDINRNEVVSTIVEKIKEITDNDQLNKFKVDNKKDYSLSITPSLNYFEFSKEFYSGEIAKFGDVIDSMYSIHKRKFFKYNLGVATFNSAWISYRNNERGTLLYPTDLINEVLYGLKDCDLKIAMMHHPLNCFKDYNKDEIENIFFNEFDFVFFGDSHKKDQKINMSGSKSVVEIISPATLTRKGEGKIGYTTFSFQEEIDEGILQVWFYDTEINHFYSNGKLEITIPRNEIKTRNNKLRKKIRELFKIELEKANDLFIFSKNEIPDNNFHTLFSTPIIRRKDDLELDLTKMDEPIINFEDFLKKSQNYLIYGLDKSGKSLILKKIQLSLLESFSEFSIIPILIETKKNKNDCDYLFQDFKSMLVHFSNADVQRILKDNKLAILIDDLELGNKNLENNIKKFLEDYPSSICIATTDYSVYSSLQFRTETDIPFEILFINRLIKKYIRELAAKALRLPEEAIESIINNLMDTFNQFSMPFNYWTVSMFLWIAQKTKHYSFNNSSEFIDNYIDGLINKDYLSTSSDTFTFVNYKSYLSELAFFLYSNYENSDYAASYIEILSFTKDYIDNDLRKVADSRKVLDYVLERAILKDYGNDKINFRLKGDFEYFLAFYMVNNEVFRNALIDNDEKYLAFGNEFELYSGINKRDSEFLQKIFDKTKILLDPINSNYNKRGTIDNNLISLVDINMLDQTAKHNKLESTLKENPLSYSEQDKFDDLTYHKSDTKVSKKKMTPLTEINYFHLEKCMFILCRVFRNLDSLSDRELQEAVFNFIIESYCNLGFLLSEEFDILIKKIDEYDDPTINSREIQKIKKIVTLALNYMPILIEVSMYNGIGHINLIKLINSKISELEKDFKNNQFMLFILYFLLIDISFDNKGRIEDVEKFITIKSLLSSSLSKILSYYVFKSHKSIQMQEFFKSKARIIQKLINPSMDKKDIDQNIVKLYKRKLIDSKKEK